MPKFLVVDDSATMRKIIMKGLKDADLGELEFVQAADGVEGLEALGKEEGIDVILSDINMPNMDGIEFVQHVRDQKVREASSVGNKELIKRVGVTIPIVMITTEGGLDKVQEALAAGANDYLKKPFNPDEFREVLDRVMRKKGLLRTPEENLHRVIGETIRGLRKDRGLTLKQMARRTGLSVSLLSQIERAESSASISSLYKIATALDVRIQDLFGEY